MTTTRLEGGWLDAPATRAVVDALGPDRVRFVGGAVRDSLLGRPVTDIDLATPLTPGEVIARLEAAGLKAVPTGIGHGTVTAIARRTPFEVTTLRRDVETFGRHARVAFTEDWRADAARRDFTINALYAAPDGTVFDYFGGIDDAFSGRVRFIGDPRARIEEDALRILRFFRFHAHYGRGPFDPEGLAACAAGRRKLDILSVERVRDELVKLLAAPDPVPALRAMAEAGILAHILPEVHDLDRLARLVAVESGLGRCDPLRRLAALLPEEALAHVGRRLRLSNRACARLAAMAGPVPLPDRAVLERCAYRDGREAVIDRLLLAADPARLDAVASLIAGLEAWRVPRFPLRGRDLVAAGVPAGPDMGRLLRRLEERWVESGFTLGKADLLDQAGREVMS